MDSQQTKSLADVLPKEFLESQKPMSIFDTIIFIICCAIVIIPMAQTL